MTERPRRIRWPEPTSFSGSGTDLLTGATFDGEVPVPAGETVVLRLG